MSGTFVLGAFVDEAWSFPLDVSEQSLTQFGAPSPLLWTPLPCLLEASEENTWCFFVAVFP